MKIGFIGTGKLGMPCAEAIAEKGHDVRGYDVVNHQSKTVLMCSDIYTCVNDRDIVFIAVPTAVLVAVPAAVPSVRAHQGTKAPGH